MSDQKPEVAELGIVKLKPREHVRLRPGMYIGGVDQRALHQLVFEVIKDSVEEAFLNFCTHLWITLYPNDVITMRDNGRGLPIRLLNDGMNTLEAIMTEVGTRRILGEYQVAYGMMGVGLAAVNALSAECTAEVTRDGFLWQQSYREGVPQSEVLQVRPMHEGESTGTSITFRPDFTILERNSFSYDILANRARELAYLLPNFTVTLRDERQEPAKQDEFHFSNGLADYLNDLNLNRHPLHPPLFGSVEWTLKNNRGQEWKLAADVALQYIDTLDTHILGYVNTMPTLAGRHTETLPFALSSLIGRWHHLELDDHASIEECLPGLTAVVSIKHPHPSYASATKTDVINPEMVGIVFVAVNEALHGHGKSEARDRIVEKLAANRRALALKQHPIARFPHLQDQRLRLKRRRGNRS